MCFIERYVSLIKPNFRSLPLFSFLLLLFLWLFYTMHTYNWRVVYRQQLKLTLGSAPDQIFQLDKKFEPFLPKVKDVFPFPSDKRSPKIVKNQTNISSQRGDKKSKNLPFFLSPFFLSCLELYSDDYIVLYSDDYPPKDR